MLQRGDRLETELYRYYGKLYRRVLFQLFFGFVLRKIEISRYWTACLSLPLSHAIDIKNTVLSISQIEAGPNFEPVRKREEIEPVRSQPNKHSLCNHVSINLFFP